MKTSCILVPFFGPWPAWFPLYLKSCGYNPGINWLIIGDSPPPKEVPDNVTFLTLPLEELFERINRILGVKTAGLNAYKLCDFKPAYGEIFEEEIAGYDFFGWGDLDLVYGRIEDLIAPQLEEFDIFSFQSWVLSNHTCLFRRNPRLVSLFRESPGWQEKMESEIYACFDDRDFSTLVIKEPRRWMHECYNTPNMGIPWVDGSCRFPSRWMWNHGVLTNNLDVGYQFAYFHFMVWKAGRNDVLPEFKQWKRHPLVNFNVEDYAAQSDSYIFTNEGISFNLMKPGRAALPFLYDATVPKPTFFNKLLKKLRRSFVGYSPKAFGN